MNKPGRSDGIIRLPIIDKPFYLNGVLSIQLASPCNIGRSFSPVNADRSGMTCDKVDFPVPRRYEVSADWICVLINWEFLLLKKYGHYFAKYLTDRTVGNIVKKVFNFSFFCRRCEMPPIRNASMQDPYNACLLRWVMLGYPSPVAYT